MDACGYGITLYNSSYQIYEQHGPHRPKGTWCKGDVTQCKKSSNQPGKVHKKKGPKPLVYGS